jgi:hypothetical protein
MQVFVTYPSAFKSAEVLDVSRCNKQIQECNQIYKAATGQSKGWANHCVTRLWANDLEWLMAFAWACYYHRLRKNGNPIKPCANPNNVASAVSCGLDDRLTPPHFTHLTWWTDAMRSHLLAKDPVHYGKFDWNVPIKHGYYAINKAGDWELYSAQKEK